MPTTPPKAFYSFLPHVRLGLAGLITKEDTLAGPSNVGERAEFNLKVPVLRTPKSGGAVSTHDLTRQVKLKGPGDITGINKKEIVKVSPADWVTNFESNYLPYIEFYDEDFPWRFTPAAATNRETKDSKLRPWLALVVLEESEFKKAEFNGILPSIIIQKDASVIFQRHDQIWAWAHVHVNRELSNNNSNAASINAAVNNLRGLLSKDPDAAVSRIMCPRKLAPNTGYHAFLIPTFELGRLAGLGQAIPVPNTIDALTPSWTSATTTGKEYPVYHQWFFKTGAAGDFESLVRLLKPNAVGADVGKRAVDLQLPGHPLLDFKTADPIIGLEGALAPPTQAPDVWPPAVPDVFTDNLKSLINLPAKMKVQAPGTLPASAHATSGADPVITPPIYGQWHAAQEEVTGGIGTNWLSTANLDPRYRIFAGAGAEVVRTNQEQYMHTAWQQVGQIIEANIKIRKMQLAARSSAAMHVKHLEPLPDENLIGISDPVHSRVRIQAAATTAPAVTAFKTIKDSVVPNAMFSAAFRRMTRTEGPLMRSVNATAATTNTVSFATMVQDVNAGVIQIAPPAGTPAGQVSLNAVSSSIYNPGYVSSLPGQSNFTFAAPPSLGGPLPLPPAYGANSLAGQQYVGAATLIANFVASQPITAVSTNPALDTAGTAAAIKERTQPLDTVLELAQSQIRLQNDVIGVSEAITKLDIILAAPKINVPVYKEMVRESTEWLMPNLNSIVPNSVSLLKTNQAYIEAYMLGMNHEMARELLWREYPTDQRGTCFSYFWDPTDSTEPPVSVDPFSRYIPDFEGLQDIKPIHEWKLGNNLTQLGTNTGRLATTNSDLLVLTIRGELLRKYPGALVYLQKAEWQKKGPGNPNPNDPDFGVARLVDADEPIVPPVFFSSLEPDIYFLGFDKTVLEVQGSLNPVIGAADPGYYIVFQERAGEVRFGADEGGPSSTTVGLTLPVESQADWSGLSWGHIQKNAPGNFIDVGGSITVTKAITVPDPSTMDLPVWGRNSADMAHILLQDPVKLYVHAKELIPA